MKARKRQIENIFVVVVLQARVLLAKLNNFEKTLESQATGIHTRVSLRDKM